MPSEVIVIARVCGRARLFAASVVGEFTFTPAESARMIDIALGMTADQRHEHESQEPEDDPQAQYSARNAGLATAHQTGGAQAAVKKP